MTGRMEKSSEIDSIGESDASKASNVTGTPSIWNTTQRQSKEMIQAMPTPRLKKQASLTAIRFMPKSYRLSQPVVKGLC